MSSRPLLLAYWLSATFFACYIVIFYGGAIVAGTLANDWNQVLPRIHQAGAISANIAIGAHFLAGAVLLICGPLQLLPSIRARWPRLHRINGRLFVAAALLTGIAGLFYLAVKGAVGGTMMTAAFGLYGVLVVATALLTIYHARAGRIAQHRAWAIRLFALAIGSWLYRIEFGLWLNLFDKLGHAKTFDGPFDQVMNFLFYVPNLIVAEIVIARQRRGPSPASRVKRAGILGATVCVLAVTYLFGSAYWLPHIVDRLAPLFQAAAH